MKRTAQLGDLDLEVLNPVETKKVLGGAWYDYDDYRYHDIEGIIMDGGNGGGGGGWDYYPGHGPGDGGGPGDYGGGGGTGSGPGESVHLPHKVTMDTQLSGMGACVSYAMAFAASYLGTNISGNSMAVHNATVLGVGVNVTTQIGLTVAQAQTAIQAYFNTNSLNNMGQLENAINQNHTVIAGPSGHEVNIIGYDNNTSTFDTWDPNTGYGTASYSSIDLSQGAYEIVSVKP